MSQITAYPIAARAENAGHVLGINAQGVPHRFGFSNAPESIYADRTYYVRTDGSDANDGLSNTAGGAKLTIAGAMNVINPLDFNGHTVTLQLQNVVYSGENLSFRPSIPTLDDSAAFVVDGGGGTVNTISTTGSGYGKTNQISVSNLTANKIESNSSICYLLSGVTIAGWGPGSILLRASYGGYLAVVGDINLTTNGIGSNGFVYAEETSVLDIFGDINIAGTGDSFDPFAYAQLNSSIRARGALSNTGGAITGTRYYAYGNSVIDVNGGGANYFPGDVAGVSSDGGVYIA